MRTAALIIGIFGAIAAFIGSIFALIIGGIGGALGVDEAGTVVVAGWIALLMSIVALVGAALSIAKPKVAAALMVISAIVGVIAVFVAYVLGTVLLIIAAFLAYLGRRKQSD